MSKSVGRNEPCPCGSGLKYKQCCAGKMRLNLKGRRGWVLGALGLVLVAVVAWSLMRPQTPPPASSGVGLAPPMTAAGTAPSTNATPNPVATKPAPLGTATSSAPSGPAGATPQPWAYDPTTNRHFDPGHGHWHDGPPPPPEAREASSTPQPPLGATASGTTPAAWTYDPQKNQHWDPAHGHWHPGPPPAGSR